MRRLGHRKLKVGHAGTLDPLATGVLLICLGRATKRVDELQAQQKEYLTTITLGATTPSYDLEHPIDCRYPYEHLTREEVAAAVQEMVGEQLQTPPVYSAKMIEGKRGYEYARDGAEVKMRQSQITIYEITLERFELPEVELRIRCSKGTYIRSIARDLGEKLGCGGHLTALCRTQSGAFTLEDCYTLEEVEQLLLPDWEPKETERPVRSQRRFEQSHSASSTAVTSSTEPVDISSEASVTEHSLQEEKTGSEVE